MRITWIYLNETKWKTRTMMVAAITLQPFFRIKNYSYFVLPMNFTFYDPNWIIKQHISLTEWSLNKLFLFRQTNQTNQINAKLRKWTLAKIGSWCEIFFLIHLIHFDLYILMFLLICWTLASIGKVYNSEFFKIACLSGLVSWWVHL